MDPMHNGAGYLDSTYQVAKNSCEPNIDIFSPTQVASKAPPSTGELLDGTILSLQSTKSDVPLPPNDLDNPKYINQALSDYSDEELGSVSRTIHIIGTSPVGLFIAHGLAGSDFPSPVTLVMHRPLLVQQWYDGGETIRVSSRGVIKEQSGFGVELAPNFDPRDLDSKHGKIFNISDEVIDNLIITTSGATTVAALASIRHRLRPQSTICFIQHGAGVIEEVNKLLFPDPEERPNYMLGTISHGLFASHSQWLVSHTGQGALNLTIINRHPATPDDGTVVRRLDHGWAPTSRYMMMVLCRHPDLYATGLIHSDFLKSHFQFVAVNSVIGPLSVIYDCSCDQLLYNYQATLSMKALLLEISKVLRALPEFKESKSVGKHFSVKRLQSVVFSVLALSRNNLTTMLKNVREGKKTDIDFYNGYLAKRARELEIPFVANELVVNLVKAKQAMKSREMNSYIPIHA